MSVLYAPESFDWDGYSARLDSRLIRKSREYRRSVSYDSPLIFALIYLDHHMSSPETGGKLSVASLHLDFDLIATDWMRHDLQPKESRHGIIAPRESAKTTWWYLFVPLWALAHGHRGFIAAFSNSGKQARQHLATLKRELATNPWLRRDYPDLCRPMSRAGRSDTDTLESYLASSGAALMARGIDQGSLGMKIGQRRPDTLILDDPEPGEARYTMEARDKRLKAIFQEILPMNENAPLIWLGTTTIFGGLAHDLVRAALGEEPADWINEMKIVPHYYPAIVTAPDGTETSYWEQRWPIEQLRQMRGTRSFDMNMNNQPRGLDGGLWTNDDIIERPDVDVISRSMWIDAAVTSKRRSDFTAIAVIGRTVAGDAVVEFARGLKVAPEQRREWMTSVLALFPSITDIHVETNQGGDDLLSTLSPPPVGTRLLGYHSDEAKGPVRFARNLDYCQRGWVILSGPQPELRNQWLAWPKVTHDDVMDAVAAGCEDILKDRPK